MRLTTYYLRRRSLLALSHQRLNARQRLLFLSYALDGVNFSQRQLEVQTKERLFQPISFRL
jgi:hypothetical protein